MRKDLSHPNVYAAGKDLSHPPAYSVAPVVVGKSVAANLAAAASPASEVLDFALNPLSVVMDMSNPQPCSDAIFLSIALVGALAADAAI